MKIKAKLLWTLMGMALLVALVGGVAIDRQHSVVFVGATKGAEAVGQVLGAVFQADTDLSHPLTADVVRRLHQSLGGDYQIVDPAKRIVADAVSAEVGTIAPDPGGALGAVMRAGRPRTYIEPAPGHLPGIRQIAVPIKSASGSVLGAVTLEYTPLYNDMTDVTRITTCQLVLAALAGAVAALCAALWIGKSIAGPLRQLTTAAVAFAEGRTGLPMPSPRNDEIGDLTAAFNLMVVRREEANAHIRQLADDLARERGRFADLLNSIPAVVFEWWPSGDGSGNFVNSHVKTMYGYTPEEWLSTPDFWASRIHPDDKERAEANVGRILETGCEPENMAFRWITKDNRVIWAERRLAVIRDPVDGTMGVRGFTLDITHQKDAERALETAHTQLLESSRHAGMAEVATNVLHNVGNVLNSVNICATVAAENVRQSSAPHLGRVAALLQENAANLGPYLDSDPTGRKLLPFLGQLAGQLDVEQAAILKELDQLKKDVEHIKDIVAVQQSYASVAGVSQTVSIADLVEDSLRMNACALLRHDVQLIREFEARPTIEVDTHKVMQILVNLIRNAKYACDESGRGDKRLTVRITGDDRVTRISVIDNGVGIPAENMTRIFSHGFTTRKTGHGFGLHSSVLAAREIGGDLLVHSDGPDCGAAFTLELPFRTPQPSQSPHGS